MKDFFNKHHYKIITITTIVILIGFSYQVMAYLFSLKEDPVMPPSQKHVRTVQTWEVKYSVVKAPVKGEGRVLSTQTIILSSEVKGKILQGDVPFKKGQAFEKGQVLIKIYNEDFLLSLKSQKSNFLQNIAGIIPDIKVDYPGSYDKWMSFFNTIDINKDLPELPPIGTEQEKIFLASRNILTEYYSIKSNEITLKKYTIRAPFDGSFTAVSMEVGAIANTGAVLAEIVRTDKLEAEISIRSDNAKWIELNDEVILTAANETKHWRGTVNRMSDFVNLETQSISVFVGLTNSKDNPLLIGEWVKAEFPGKHIENVMDMPRNAVFNSNEVFIVVDGKLAKRNIDIKKLNEKTLLFSGLEEGALLVVEPLVNVLENSPVEIMR